jgi:hypothetical protein
LQAGLPHLAYEAQTAPLSSPSAGILGKGLPDFAFASPPPALLSRNIFFSTPAMGIQNSQSTRRHRRHPRHESVISMSFVMTIPRIIFGIVSHIVTH